MTRVNVMEARQHFSKTVNRVAFGKERLVLERRGEDVVAVIPVDELKLFERLLDEYEDRLDVEEARRRLADPRALPPGRLTDDAHKPRD